MGFEKLALKAFAVLGTFFLSLFPLTVQADGLRNAGAYISPSTATAGDTVSLTHAVVADYAISNAVIQTEIRLITDSGIVSASLLTTRYYNQTFAAGEQKNFTVSYPVPAGVAGGTYSFVLTALSEDERTQYYQTAQTTAPYTFSITGGRATAAAATAVAVATGSYLRGINIMDMAIGASNLPGAYNTNYTRPSLENLKLLAGRGYNVVRLPFLWERVQPSLGGPLDSAYLQLIVDTLRDVDAAGMKAILDLHNYGRYTTGGTEYMIGKEITENQFVDVWQKISAALRADGTAYGAVYAYDLMNEPHDLDQADPSYPAGVWVRFAQAAVTGIRSVNDSKLIMVEGYSWASAANWPDNHPNRFIADSAGNLMYQAHLYMDTNAGGIYNLSFDQETALARAAGFESVSAQGIYRANRFADWCSREQVRCFIGEYGWPNSNVAGVADAQRWNDAGETLMSYFDSVGLGATQWATGSWLSPTDNVLNSYQLQGSGGFTPLSQTGVMERHLGR